jgi:beta-1,4-mannosyltransferase
MKVVDMFGCGLPVCAVHFECLSELVVHEHNGRLLHQFPHQTADLQRLAHGVKGFQSVRWQDNWDECAKPIFQQAQRSPYRPMVVLTLLIVCLAWLLSYVWR